MVTKTGVFEFSRAVCVVVTTLNREFDLFGEDLKKTSLEVINKLSSYEDESSYKHLDQLLVVVKEFGLLRKKIDLEKLRSSYGSLIPEKQRDVREAVRLTVDETVRTIGKKSTGAIIACRPGKPALIIRS
jgi:hypothetical protein